MDVENAVPDVSTSDVTDVQQVDDQQVVETPTDDTQTAENTDTSADDQTQDQDADLADPSAPLPPYARVKAQIEKLKTDDPQAAKELKNLYFEVQAIRQAAPGGVPQIKKALETIEALGGEEGIQQIEAQKAEWAGIDEQFEAGDAKVLDGFSARNPEAFAKITAGALDKLASVDRATYDRTLSGIFTATLDNWRFMDSLERLYETLSTGENAQKFPREIQMLQGLAKGYDDLRKLATAQPKKETDTERQKLEAERAKFNQEQTKAHGDYVASETKSYANQKYETLIGAEAKAQGLKVDGMKDSPAYQRMINEIDQAIAQEIVKDKPAVEKIRAAIAAGRRGDAVKLSNAKFDQVAAKSIQKVVREWAGMLNPARPTRKPPVNGNPPIPAGVRKLETQPQPSQMKQYEGWKEDYMEGKGRLASNGQQVTW